jgi:hypothetical protein
METSSEVALQRVLVRMLFDPTFAAAVTKDPHGVLRAYSFASPLLDQLKRLDVRLWSADRHRPLRAMKILAAEFRISTTLLLDARRSFHELMAFFRHDTFHQSVQQRGYMALAFATFLKNLCHDLGKHAHALPHVLALEAGMALARREAREWRRGSLTFPCSGSGPTWRLQPGKVLVCVRQGTLSVVQSVEKFLFEASELPQLSLCQDSPRPSDGDALLQSTSEHFLLECGEGGQVGMSTLSEEYAAVAASVVGAVDAHAWVAPEQISGERARDLLEALIAAEVVVDVCRPRRAETEE